jgi:hypothetical protein
LSPGVKDQPGSLKVTMSIINSQRHCVLRILVLYVLHVVTSVRIYIFFLSVVEGIYDSFMKKIFSY